MKKITMRSLMWGAAIVAALFICETGLDILRPCAAMGGTTLTTAPRISVQEARQNTLSGESLLVCAYKDDSQFNTMRLDRGISLNEFLSKLPDISKKREIIFYCS